MIQCPHLGVFSIISNDDRQHESDGLPVNDAEPGGQRIGGSVGRAEHAILDGQTAERRPQQHVAASDNVLWVFEHSLQAANAKPERPRESICEMGLRRFVVIVSTACDNASMPVVAATEAGCVSVNSGSRMARRASALGSPQAIFTCVSGFEIKAND